MAGKMPHSSELNMRRLYKECVECVKRLDQTTKDKETLSSIFSPEIISVRKKLCDSCEKLFFHKPLEFGRKTEEIVWRKCFYEPINHVRRNVSSLTNKQRALFSMLLSSASGYYINLLIKIQQEFNVNLHNAMDFNVGRLKWYQTTTTKPGNKNVDEIILDLAHRFYIYLGDLSRYQHEFEKSIDFQTAQRYYHAALQLKPYHGQPHNQLGTLFAGCNHNLDAVFCYLRCIFSSESFSGAEGNLLQLLEKSQKEYKKYTLDAVLASSDVGDVKNIELKYFLVSFLNLCKILYEDSNEFNSGQQLQQICQQLLQSFTLVIDHLLSTKLSIDLQYSIESTMIAKIFVTMIMLIKKLQEKSSLKLAATISLLVSMYANFLTHVIAVITGCVTLDKKLLRKEDKNVKKWNAETSKVDDFKNGSGIKILNKTNVSSKPPLFSLLRRRRRDEGEESEGEKSSDEADRNSTVNSDNESTNQSSDSDSDDVIEIDDEDETNGNTTKSTSSDVELIQDSIDPSSDAITKQPDGEESDAGLWSRSSSNVSLNVDPIDIRKLNLKEMLVYLSHSNWLVVVKILCDWFRCNSNLVVSMSGQLKILWNRFAQLINLLPNEEKLLEFINADLRLSHELKNSLLLPLSDWYQKIPIVEDLFLRGVPSFSQAHNGLDYVASQCYSMEGEVSVRIFCFRSFGHYLLRLNTAGFRYDRLRNEFFGQLEGKTVVEEMEQDKRENLMRNMAKLRLKDEMAKIDKIAWIPVYLVADASALCEKLSLIKQFVAVRKFVLVVPKSVVDELDRMKKESADAREAIRWLEQQFQRGSKHVRMQKIDETAQIRDVLTNILSSKTNSRELIGLIDCSAFLSRTVTSGASTVVCILTNDPLESNELDSLTTAVNSTNLSGVAVENVQKFWNRWENYMKKGGNS